MHIGSAEAELAGPCLQDDAGRVGFDELFGDVLGAVRGAIVDDDEFPIDVAEKGERRLDIAQFRRNQTARIAAYFSVKVRANNQVIIGRFWRSLKVGRITE